MRGVEITLKLGKKEIEEKADLVYLLPWMSWIRVSDVKEPEGLLESISRHEDPKKWYVSSPGCLPIGFYVWHLKGCEVEQD